MAWGKAGSTTLTSSGTDLSVTSMTNSSSGMALGLHSAGGTSIKLNNDNGSNGSGNYAVGRSSNGGAKSNNSSRNGDNAYITDVRANPHFNVTYFINIASEAKLWINSNVHQNTAGAGNAPAREQGVGKWHNTSDAISQFDYHAWNGTYASGDNITVFGSDITPTVGSSFPTNVQVGSRAEITDSRKMYNYSERTKTVDENFDSTGLLTWTESDSSKISVDSSTNERLDFDFKRDGTNDTAYHQLSSALSDSAWVMDFDLTFSNLAQTGGGDAICGFIGMASSYEADNSDSHDGMYLQIVVNNSIKRFQATAQNNTTLVAQAVSEGTQFTSTTPSTTTFYVRLIRNGNDLTGQFFSTSARTGTATEEKTQTISGITGLSYITIKNLDFSAGSVGSNAVAGYIDNLKIYDGITSASNYWQEIGA